MLTRDNAAKPAAAAWSGAPGDLGIKINLNSLTTTGEAN
jgi:hypothetical protein